MAVIRGGRVINNDQQMVDTKKRHLFGSGAPTSTTYRASRLVGDIYENTDDGRQYTYSNPDGRTPTWTLLVNAS